jgi:hypothetical protein
MHNSDSVTLPSCLVRPACSQLHVTFHTPMPSVPLWQLFHQANMLRTPIAIALAGKGLAARFSRPRAFGMDHVHGRAVVPTFIDASAADKLVEILDPTTGRLQLAEGLAVNVEIDGRPAVAVHSWGWPYWYSTQQVKDVLQLWQPDMVVLNVQPVPAPETPLPIAGFSYNMVGEFFITMFLPRKGLWQLQLLDEAGQHCGYVQWESYVAYCNHLSAEQEHFRKLSQQQQQQQQQQRASNATPDVDMDTVFPPLRP